MATVVQILKYLCVWCCNSCLDPEVYIIAFLSHPLQLLKCVLASEWFTVFLKSMAPTIKQECAQVLLEKWPVFLMPWERTRCNEGLLIVGCVRLLWSQGWTESVIEWFALAIYYSSLRWSFSFVLLLCFCCEIFRIQIFTIK